MEKRHPALIAVVFVFGLFLASVPFLFSVERSPYSEALSLYDRLCAAADSGDVKGFRAGLTKRAASLTQLEATLLMSRLRCVDRLKSENTFDPVRGRAYGPHRAYDLTLRTPGSQEAVRMRFVMEDEILLWSP